MENSSFAVDVRVNVLGCLCLSEGDTTKTDFYSLLLITIFESHIKIWSSVLLSFTQECCRDSNEALKKWQTFITRAYEFPSIPTRTCVSHRCVLCVSRTMCMCFCMSGEARHVRFWLVKDSGPELLPSEEGRWSQHRRRGQSSSERSGSLVRWALPLTAGELLSEHAAGTVLACTLTMAPPRRQGSQCVMLTHCSLCLWALLQTASVSLWNLRNSSAQIKSSYNPG